MTYENYQTAYNAAIALYQNGEFAQALNLLTEIKSQFPDDRMETDYLRSCLAVRVDNIALTYQILDEFYADDLWLSEAIFRDSPSYAPLQGKTEFEQRVKAHVELRAKASAFSPGQLFTLKISGNNTLSPTLIHLHGNGSHPSIELPQWQAAVDNGWQVAALTSEEEFWAGGRAVWSNHEKAEKQLGRDFEKLKKDHLVDENQIILTGFSMGGDVAIAQTLKGDVVHTCGFLVVAPGGPMIDEPESFLPLIRQAQGRNLRGIIMVSRKDNTIDPDKANKLTQLLNDNNIPCRFIEYPEEGHFYPSDFGAHLPALLGWITGG